MLTTNKVLDFIAELGLLSNERTHMVTEIVIRPFEGKVSVDVIVDSDGTTEHYHLPVFDFGDDE
jgi:hypothetical protein